MTYYQPILNGLSVNCVPQVVSNGSYSTVTINAPASYADKKTFTIRTSSPASLSNTSNVLSSSTTVSGSVNSVSVKVYNKNVALDNRSVNLDVCVNAVNGSYYASSSAQKTLTLMGAPMTSYYEYYDKYFTYFSNGQTTTTYYKINSFKITPSVSSVAHGSYFKLTPSLSVNYSNAYTAVSSVKYSIGSPYTLSLSNSKTLYNGTASNLGSVNVYNNTSSYYVTYCSVSATVTLKNGLSKVATTQVAVGPKQMVVKPTINISSSNTVTAGDNLSLNAVYTAATAIKSIIWSVTPVAGVAISGSTGINTSAVLTVDKTLGNCAVLVSVKLTNVNGDVVSASKQINITAAPVVPSNSSTTVSYFNIYGPSVVDSAVKSKEIYYIANNNSSVVANTNSLLSSFGISPSTGKFANGVAYNYSYYFGLTKEGVYAELSINKQLPEDMIVPLYVSYFVNNDVKGSISKNVTVKAIPEVLKPRIVSSSLITIPSNGSVEFDGTASVGVQAAVENDSIAYLVIDGQDTTVSYYSPNKSTRTFADNVKSINTSISTLHTRPEVYHSSQYVAPIKATIITASGLVQDMVTNVTIKPTNLSYYNSYYAPVVTIGTSGPNTLAYDGVGTMTANISVVRDTIDTITWKSSDDELLSIEGPNNVKSISIAAHNESEIQKTATLTVTVKTVSGISKTYTRSIRISGKPVIEDKKPSVDETAEKIAYIFDNAKNQALAELYKLA